MRKQQKIHYDVSVHLSDDKTFFRLKFWHKATRTYLKEFERRCIATSYEAAKVERDTEQLNEKWREYNNQVLNIVTGCFISYMRQLIASIKYEPTQKVYKNNLQTFIDFFQCETLPFSKMEKKLIDKYREWCLSEFPSQGTASLKFGFICLALKKAEDDENINLKHIPVKRIPAKTLKKKNILTEDDLNKLLATPYESPDGNSYRKVFLFECLTGVSYIDLKRLLWKQVYNKTIVVNNIPHKTTQLTYERFKTGEEVTICLSDEVLSLLGKRKGGDEKIFPFITTCKTYNDKIQTYMKEAGITKYITSHCGRATAIVRVIETEGLYQAQKQVGHKEIESTLQYAQFTTKMMMGNSKALTQGLVFNRSA